jgi:hypothetical protein
MSEGHKTLQCSGSLLSFTSSPSCFSSWSPSQFPLQSTSSSSVSQHTTRPYSVQVSQALPLLVYGVIVSLRSTSRAKPSDSLVFFDFDNLKSTVPIIRIAGIHHHSTPAKCSKARLGFDLDSTLASALCVTVAQLSHYQSPILTRILLDTYPDQRTSSITLSPAYLSSIRSVSFLLF